MSLLCSQFSYPVVHKNVQNIQCKMYKNPYVFKITIQQQQKCLNGVVKEKESELSLGQLFITWA